MKRYKDELERIATEVAYAEDEFYCVQEELEQSRKSLFRHYESRIKELEKENEDLRKHLSKLMHDNIQGE